MDEEGKAPSWLIPDKAYDVLKWVGLIVCPASATLMLTIGEAWGVPFAGEIATTIVALGTFVGALIGASAVKGGALGGDADE